MESTIRPVWSGFGAHVRYVGNSIRALPLGPTRREVVLTPGMIGVVILSAGPSRPSRCRLQFRNGFQLDVSAENQAEFAPVDTRVPACPNEN